MPSSSFSLGGRSLPQLRGTKDQRRALLVLAVAAAVAGTATALLWLRLGRLAGSDKKKGRARRASASATTTTTTTSSSRSRRGASTADGTGAVGDAAKLEREEISKVFDEISMLIASERLNADALERLRAQLQHLEEQLLASHEHIEELEARFLQQQHQTAAILAPLRQEIVALKHQVQSLVPSDLGALPCTQSDANGTAPSTAAASAAAAAAAFLFQGPRQASRAGAGIGAADGVGAGAGAGSGDAAIAAPLLGSEEAEALLRQSQSHLATVAMALGVTSPGRPGKQQKELGSGPASSPRDGNGFIISDWSDFH